MSLRRCLRATKSTHAIGKSTRAAGVSPLLRSIRTGYQNRVCYRNGYFVAGDKQDAMSCNGDDIPYAT